LKKKPSPKLLIGDAKNLALLLKILTKAKEIASNLGNATGKYKAVLLDSSLLNIKEQLGNVFNNLLISEADKKLNEYQVCYLLKDGIDGLLDVARKTLQEATEDVQSYAEELSSVMKIELKTKYLPQKRFILTAKLQAGRDLPKAFHQIMSGKSLLGYGTVELVISALLLANFL